MKYIEWHKPSDCVTILSWIFWRKSWTYTDGTLGVSLRIFGFQFAKG